MHTPFLEAFIPGFPVFLTATTLGAFDRATARGAGDIPANFTFPAALGDIWAGLEGLRAWRRNDPKAESAIWRATVIDLTDDAVALGFGITTIAAEYAAPAPPNIVENFPLIVIPTVFVPIFLTLHLLPLA